MSLPVDGPLVTVAGVGAALLVPLTVGLLVGYWTPGRTDERLRAGARAGLLLAVVATALAGTYLVGVLLPAGTHDRSTLLTLVPTAVLVVAAIAALYSVSVSVIGSALGGHLRMRSVYAP